MVNTVSSLTAVIGGGIIGLSIAVTLQKSGQKVILIEKGKIGSGASAGNAGHLATEQVYPVADPSVLKQLPKMLLDPLGPLNLNWKYLPKIAPWFFQVLRNMGPENFHKSHLALSSLNRVSLHAWESFAAEWGVERFLRVDGSLLVVESKKNIKTAKNLGSKLNELGVSNQWLSGGELLDLEPGLKATQQGGLFYPKTGHVTNLNRMLCVLKNQFIVLGGVIKENAEVTHLERKEKTVTVHILNSLEKTIVDSIVLTTGAFSKPLTKQLANLSVPLETERGYHLMLPKEKDRLSIPVTSLDRRFIMTPMEGGLRLAGTVEYAGLNIPPNMKRAHNFVPLANQILKNPVDTANASPWMGFRPTLSDSLPIIDRTGNVLYAFGHQHLGLTQAPITAKMIESLFYGKKPPVDCRPFAIDRFS